MFQHRYRLAKIRGAAARSQEVKYIVHCMQFLHLLYASAAAGFAYPRVNRQHQRYERSQKGRNRQAPETHSSSRNATVTRATVSPRAILPGNRLRR